MEDRFDLPQGTLDLLIMRVVALGPIHGYAIAQRIQQMSREVLQVQQGSLYPALHRLEYKKLLASKWELSETGREAKFYELTVKGRAHLEVETENWKRLTDVVGLILKGTLEGLSSAGCRDYSRADEWSVIWRRKSSFMSTRRSPTR